MPSDKQILVHRFTEAQKRSFLELGIPDQFAIQAVILKEGEWGNDMLMVVEGVVSAWVQNAKVGEVVVETVLGAPCLIVPHPRTATLIAETEVRVLRFGRDSVQEYFDAAPSNLYQQFLVNISRST